tara:strand:+ start:124 stop:822 length:699 start_codon:yes stop_codon:yes gene_type:complete
MSTVLENSGGPGSSITLDPEIISIRDRYLKALEGKPFDEMNLLIQKQLETESMDLKRISLLAARVYILRLRTLELRNEPTENAMPWSKPADVSKDEQKIDDQKNTEEAEKTDNEWRRLRMIEAGEVNGVRFPPGIIIDVNSVDGEKLVESKKAEYVDTSKSEDEVDETNVSSDAENKTDTTEVKTETESKETKEDKENNVKADGDNLADELAELSNSLTTEVEDNDDKKNKK